MQRPDLHAPPAKAQLQRADLTAVLHRAGKDRVAKRVQNPRQKQQSQPAHRVKRSARQHEHACAEQLRRRDRRAAEGADSREEQRARAQRPASGTERDEQHGRKARQLHRQLPQKRQRREQRRRGVHAAERRRQRQPQPQDAPASKLCRADEQQIVHRPVEQERLVGVHRHLHRLPLFVPASPA